MAGTSPMAWRLSRRRHPHRRITNNLTNCTMSLGCWMPEGTRHRRGHTGRCRTAIASWQSCKYNQPNNNQYSIIVIVPYQITISHELLLKQPAPSWPSWQSPLHRMVQAGSGAGLLNGWAGFEGLALRTRRLSYCRRQVGLG